jgi:hypothetical protein
MRVRRTGAIMGSARSEPRARVGAPGRSPSGLRCSPPRRAPGSPGPEDALRPRARLRSVAKRTPPVEARASCRSATLGRPRRCGRPGESGGAASGSASGKALAGGGVPPTRAERERATGRSYRRASCRDPGWGRSSSRGVSSGGRSPPRLRGTKQRPVEKTASQRPGFCSGSILGTTFSRRDGTRFSGAC